MVKVGYQGVQGAYSEIAVLKYFGDNAKPTSFKSFKDLIEAVEDKRVDYGMLPVENSTTGTVTKSVDLVKDYNIYVIGEEYVKVQHNLITIPEANICDIKEVYSHPEALKQCDELFENNKFQPIAFIDTAKSVEYIKTENNMHKAAIASKRAAEIYGLKILKSNIQDNKLNTTRFLVISGRNESIKDANKLSMYFVTKHEPGALFKVIKIFASNNMNMLKIESRPIKDRPFEYCFYVDVEGNLEVSKTKDAINMIENLCNELKILGNYISREKPC